MGEARTGGGSESFVDHKHRMEAGEDILGDMEGIWKIKRPHKTSYQLLGIAK